MYNLRVSESISSSGRTRDSFRLLIRVVLYRRLFQLKTPVRKFLTKCGRFADINNLYVLLGYPPKRANLDRAGILLKRFY